MADFGAFAGAFGGSAIGSAVVRLVLDNSTYTKQLAAAKGQTQTGLTAMGSGVSRFGIAAQAGFAIAGVAVLKFAAESIRAASDQSEALNKARVTFGQAAPPASSKLDERISLSFEKATAADILGFGLSQKITGWFQPLHSAAHVVKEWLRPVRNVLAKVL